GIIVKVKYLFISVGVLLVIVLAVFVVRGGQVMISNMALDSAQNKIEKTEIGDKINNQLKKEGYPVSGLVLGLYSLEDIDLKIATSMELKEDAKEEIKLIVHSLAKQNGFSPNAFSITFASVAEKTSSIILKRFSSLVFQ